MKFIISSNTLLKSLQALNGVLNSSNTLPILDDFLFVAEENSLEITASDMETRLTVKLNLDMLDEPGSITIPAKILIDTLKTFPDVPVTFLINIESQSIDISAGNANFRLSGHNALDYPTPPTLSDPVVISIDPEALIIGINKTIFATGSDELRPTMSGVFFQFTEEGSVFVATDAHKLVKYERTDVKSPELAEFIMPKKPLNSLKNILNQASEPIKVEFNVTNASFSFDNYKLICRLIEGKYPNYEAVIPKDNPNQLIIDRTMLLNAIRRIGLYANQSTHQIRFHISGQLLHLSAEDIDFANNAKEELPCEYDGNDMEIGFNSKFMLEMLQNVDSTEIKIELSAPQRAGIILPTERANESENLLMLVMPVMLG